MNSFEKIRASRTARFLLGTSYLLGPGCREFLAGPYAPLLHDKTEKVTGMPPTVAGHIDQAATCPGRVAPVVPLRGAFGGPGRAPVVAAVRRDATTNSALRVYPGFDLSFERGRGSQGGAIADTDRTAPRRARAIVRAELRYWGRPDLIESADLLVTELVTNAFEHGLGDVGLRVYLTDTHLLIEVRDGSHQFPALGDAALDDEAGRGLFLVASTADDWGVSPDGTTTWCSLPL